MQINGLKTLLKGFEPAPARSPSLPNPATTPVPERNKVTANPVRVPVNRQTALLMRPVKCWLSQPLPPEKLKTAEDRKIEQLMAELKTERNAHALTRDTLGETRMDVRLLKKVIEQLREEISALREKQKIQADIIKQLENLKL